VRVIPVQKCLIYVRYVDNDYEFRVYTRVLNAIQTQPERLANARVMYVPEYVDGSSRVNSALMQIYPLLVNASMLQATYTIMAMAQARPSYQQIWPAIKTDTGQSFNNEQSVFLRDIERMRVAMADMANSVTEEISRTYETMKKQFESSKSAHTEMESMARLDPLLQFNPLRSEFASNVPMATPPYPCSYGSRLELIPVVSPDVRLLEERRALLDDVASRYGLSMAFLRGNVVRGDAIKAQMEAIQRFMQQNLSVLTSSLANVLEIVLNLELTEINKIVIDELATGLGDRKAAVQLARRIRLSVHFVKSSTGQIGFEEALALGEHNIVDVPVWRKIVLECLGLDPNLARTENESEAPAKKRKTDS
jgi:hypothetical protein